MLKSYQAGIAGIRWLNYGGRIPPVLQYALRPINGGPPDWFNVPTDTASQASTASEPAARQESPADPLRKWLRALGYSDTAINAMGDSTTMMQRAIDAATMLNGLTEADARSPVVKAGYVCVDCGALFRAADH